MRNICLKGATPNSQASKIDSAVKISSKKQVASIAQLVKGRLSDAGGLRFESQAGQLTGKSTPSLWRDKHPAIKGLRPPEHHAGKFHLDHKKTPPSKTK